MNIFEALQSAISHHQAGRLSEAEPIYSRILAVEPTQPDALHLLGVLASQCGHHAAGEEMIRRAVAVRPSAPNFRLSLGNVLMAQGRRADAIAQFQEEIRLCPKSVLAMNNLGAALAQEGRAEDAIRVLEAAVALSPAYADALSNLGVEYVKTGRTAEGVASCGRAALLMPGRAEIEYNLGFSYMQAKDYAAAQAAYRRVTLLDPLHAKAWNDLGVVLMHETDHWEEAESSFAKALEIWPDFFWAHNNLARLLKDSGRIDQAVEAYRKALRFASDASLADIVHGNLLVTMQYQEGLPPSALREEHRRYGERVAATIAPVPLPVRDRRSNRRLRLGFVSPNFASHPVGRFLVRLLENIDSAAFEVYCYNDTRRTDGLTARICKAAACWHESCDLSDEQLAARIRADEVDVLFDLAGHTALNRLAVFARRAAPLQVTWLDYVGTTGISQMDCLLADSLQIPDGSEADYLEQVLRLPGDYVCFDPPDAPPVEATPALANGFVTFGSFNIVSKVSGTLVKAWAKILRQVPGSKIFLKNRGFGLPMVQRRYRELFEDEGVSSERVLFSGWSKQPELLASYGSVDICLDTFPYNGGLTTCEALWMGVPVVTCAGDRFAGRHSLTHLRAAGETGTTAFNLEDYVSIATKLAGDIPALEKARSGRRSRVAASSLCDGAAFARGFEFVIRQAWAERCVKP
jgi:predicted O-linked N-acetylglucosamine transferase (SPINDLY family)